MAELEQRLHEAIGELADGTPEAPRLWDRVEARVRRRVRRRRIATVSVVAVAMLSGVAVAALRPGGGSQGIEVRPAVDPEDAPRPARILVTTSNQGVLVVDSTTGRVLDTLTATTHPAYGTQDVAVDPHGRRWYFTDDAAMDQENCREPAVRAQDFGGGEVVDVATGTDLVVSPDGRFLAARRMISSGGSCNREAVEVTDLETGKAREYEYQTPEPATVRPMAFTADGKTLFASSQLLDHGSGPALWAIDLEHDVSLSDAEPVQWAGQGYSIEEVLYAFSRTDLLVAQWDPYAPVIRVDLTRGRPTRELLTAPDVQRTAVDASGRHLAVVAYDEGRLTALFRWSPGDHRAARLVADAVDAAWIPDTAPGRLSSMGASPDATATTAPTALPERDAGSPATIFVPVSRGVAEISAADGAVRRVIYDGWPIPTNREVEVDFANGWLLVAHHVGCSGAGGGVAVTKLPLGGGDGEEFDGLGRVGTSSISPDGEWLAFPRFEDGCGARALALHEISTGAERIWRLPSGAGEVIGAGWAPDGRRVAFGIYGEDGDAVYVLDTADPSASLAEAPRLTDGRLADSVVGDRWILAVIEPCDLSAAPDCASEVVTVDGDTGEVIERLGSVPSLDDVDLDASGEHVLVCWSEPDPEDPSYSISVVGELVDGKVRRIAEADCGDW